MKQAMLKLTGASFLLCSLMACGTTTQSAAPVQNENLSLAENIDQLLDSKKLPGLVLAIRKDNQLVHHQAYGYADLESKTKMTTDRLFTLHSMTKPITALNTIQVLDEKNISFDAPLQSIFTQFEQHPPIPLSTVMTHTAGFSYGFKINRWAGWLYLFSNISSSKTLPEFVDKLAELPLLSDPGVRWRYSFSSDVQGAMVEQLTGDSLYHSMEQRLFKPLGMKDTSFHVDAKNAQRIVPIYSNSWFSSSPNKAEQLEVTQAQGPQSGGGGLVSTAEDYSKFLQLLMTPKAYPDIVKAEHVALLTTNQLPQDKPSIPERFYPNSGYSYGLGVKLKDEKYLSKGSYYWAGRGGTIFWADPEQALSVVVMMQYEGGNKILEEHLIPLIYQWLENNENITG